MLKFLKKIPPIVLLALLIGVGLGVVMLLNQVARPHRADYPEPSSALPPGSDPAGFGVQGRAESVLHHQV